MYYACDHRSWRTILDDNLDQVVLQAITRLDCSVPYPVRVCSNTAECTMVTVLKKNFHVASYMHIQ